VCPDPPLRTTANSREVSRTVADRQASGAGLFGARASIQDLENHASYDQDCRAGINRDPALEESHFVLPPVVRFKDDSCRDENQGERDRKRHEPAF
jgi:hypothetical protein